MASDIDDRMTTLAARQHGVVARRQLLALGISPGAVRHRVEAGRLRPLHRGVYLVGPLMPARAREMAAVLACGRTAVLSHRSAAALWELTPAPGRSVPVDVSVSRGHPRDRSGIRVRRVARLDPEDRTAVDGIPITTPARTLIDLASDVSHRELERAVARAGRLHQIDRDRLTERAARSPRRRGMRLLRSILEERGGPALTRSEAEDRFLDLVRRAGLPPPETNVVVEGRELDFYWRLCRLAVEVDGYRFHSSRQQFENDRRRSTHLAAHGIQLVRVTWRQIVDEPIATAVQLGRALARAERR